jgi:hypothetical protein
VTFLGKPSNRSDLRLPRDQPRLRRHQQAHGCSRRLHHIATKITTKHHVHRHQGCGEVHHKHLRCSPPDAQIVIRQDRCKHPDKLLWTTRHAAVQEQPDRSAPRWSDFIRTNFTDSSDPSDHMNSWRSRPSTSPLTSSLLQQHNQMTSNLKVPGMNSGMSMNRGSIGDLHSSGYHSFTTESSAMKNPSSGAGGSSAHSSPENSMYSAKFNPSMGNFMEVSPQQKFEQSRRGSLNDSMMFNYDPRIVAGLRAMNLTPQTGEMRIPTPICKLSCE